MEVIVIMDGSRVDAVFSDSGEMRVEFLEKQSYLEAWTKGLCKLTPNDDSESVWSF
jgi:hypothetical protein